MHPERDLIDLARLDATVMDSGWRDELLANVRYALAQLRPVAPMDRILRSIDALERVESSLLAATPPGLDVCGELPGRVVRGEDVIDLDALEGE